MSRRLPWLVAGTLFVAAAALGIWGLLHRHGAGSVALAAVPVMVVVGVRMLRRLGA